MEHLFMQVFERRRWIEKQLRQQAESYSHSIASNLVADGVMPPPWLLSTGSLPPEHKELSREQLISEILCPVPSSTTPLVNNSSAFTLPILKDDNLFKPISLGCTSNDPVPDRYPKSTGQDFEIVISSKVDEACPEFDPLARIQRSRSRQRDLETRRGKRAKTMKDLRKQNTADPFTGRMTRSRAAASLKLDQVEESSIPKKLLVTQNGDRCRVTRSRTGVQKLACMDQSSQMVNVVNCVEDGIQDVAEVQLDTTNAASPSHSGLRMTKAATLQLSEINSLVEPKQLVFDGIDECNLHDASVFSLEKEAHRSLHEVALKGYEDLSANPLVCTQSERADQLSLRKNSQENLLDQASRQLSGGLEEERLKVADSGCNSRPSSYKGKNLHMLNPFSEVEPDIIEKEAVSISPVGGCIVNSFVDFSSQLSEHQVASITGSPKYFVQYAEEERRTSKLINLSANDIGSRPFDINHRVQLKHPFHTNAECSLNINSATAFVHEDQDMFSDVNFRRSEAVQSGNGGLFSCDSWGAHNSSSSKQLYKEKILHAEEVMPSEEEVGTVSHGEPEAGRPEMLVVEDSECDSLPESCKIKNKSQRAAVLMMKGTCTNSETGPSQSSTIRDCILTSGLKFEGQSTHLQGVCKSSSLRTVQHSAEEQCREGLDKILSTVLNSESSEAASWSEPLCLPSALIEESDLNELSLSGLEKEKMGNNSKVALTVPENAPIVAEESISIYSNKAEFSYPNKQLLKEQVLDTLDGRSRIEVGSSASRCQQEEQRHDLLVKDGLEFVCHPSFCQKNGSSDKPASSSEIVCVVHGNRLPCLSRATDNISKSAMDFSNCLSILQEESTFASLQSKSDHVEGKQMVAEDLIESSEQVTRTFVGHSCRLHSSGAVEALSEAGQSETGAVEIARAVMRQTNGAETYNSPQAAEHLLNKSWSPSRLNYYPVPSLKESDDCLQFKNADAVTDQAVGSCVIVTTPHTDEPERTLPEARYFLRSSTSSAKKVGSIKKNGSVSPLPNENSIAKDILGKSTMQQSVTRNNPDSQNDLTETRYFLRSLANEAKNFTSCRSNVVKGKKRVRKSMQDADYACDTTWPRRKMKDGRSKDAFVTSAKLALRPLLHVQKENADVGKAISEKATEMLELQPPGSSNEMENETSDIQFGKNTEKLSKSKQRRLTKGDPNLCRGKEAVVTNSPNKHADAAHSLDRVLEDSKKCLENDVEDIDSTTILTFTKHNTMEGPQDFELMGNILEPESLHEVITQMTGTGCRNERLSADGSARLSLYNDDLAVHEESKPEFEGFNIGAPSIFEDDMIYDDSELPSLSKERACLLGQLCGSSILSPLSRTSTKYKIHEVSDVYQSLTAGVQEHRETSKSLKFKYGDMKQLNTREDGSFSGINSKLGSNLNDTFSGGLESHAMPYLSARSGCEARKPPLTPPFKKLAQRISGKSCVSSERMDSNPELVCFRIDENSSTSEENDHPKDIPKGLFDCKDSKEFTKRRPLTDVTSEYENAPFLVPESRNFTERGSIDSVSTELHFVTHMDVYPNLGSKYLGDGKSMKHKENNSLCCGSSKPDISEKGKERNRSQTILKKGGNPTNIVSNISSFIPLVRQKQQAAAPVAGKRDIKVKALEAAEAAKRIQEKKQNEREMRKAAAKQERIRIEYEAARQLELKQKQKEEAWKKKEADIAARKRQREEEERKEKERKRRCVEETRRQQREPAERLRPEKKDRKLPNKATEENDGMRKDMAEDGIRQLKSEKDTEVVRCEKATTSEPSRVKAEEVNENKGNVDTSDALKKSNDYQVVSSSGVLQKSIQDRMSFTKGGKDQQSYEISPYKDSDDEDAEEGSRRKSKDIPQWARKEFLDQILLSNQDTDPSEIFCCKSSFNISEVLSPRILRRPLSQI